MLPIENSSPYQKENQGMYAKLSVLILQNIKKIDNNLKIYKFFTFIYLFLVSYEVALNSQHIRTNSVSKRPLPSILQKGKRKVSFCAKSLIMQFCKKL